MINPDKIEAGNQRISKFMERSHLLNYHESWNLLMPVIEKLTQEKFRAVLYFNPDAASSVLYDPLNHRLETAINGPRESGIMTVWQSVVEFIETLSKRNELNA
jgi:hypothetical protein